MDKKTGPSRATGSSVPTTPARRTITRSLTGTPKTPSSPATSTSMKRDLSSSSLTSPTTRARRMSDAVSLTPTKTSNSPSGSDRSFTSYMSAEYIKRVAKTANFKEIKVLKLWQSDSKITFMENLELLVNLQELDLSDNHIDKMRNLESSKQLRVLNLSKNRISVIACIDTLQKLQVLDLSDNLIERIPVSMKFLVSLHTLKLHNNKLSNMRDIVNLKPLKTLATITLSGNPIAELEHMRLYAVFQLPTVSNIDDQPVTDSEREQAALRFTRDEIEELEANLAKEKAASAQLKQDVERLESELKKAAAREEQLKKQMVESNARVSTIEAELATANQMLSKKTAELVSLCGLLYEMKQELALLNIDRQFDSVSDPNWQLVEDTLASAGVVSQGTSLRRVYASDSESEVEVSINLDSPYIGQKANVHNIRAGNGKATTGTPSKVSLSDSANLLAELAGSAEDESLEFDDDDADSSRAGPTTPRVNLFSEKSARTDELKRKLDELQKLQVQQERTIQELKIQNEELERKLADEDVARVAAQLRVAKLEEQLVIKEKQLEQLSPDVERAKLLEEELKDARSSLSVLSEKLEESLKKNVQLETELNHIKQSPQKNDESARLAQQLDDLKAQTDVEKKSLSETLASVTMALKLRSDEAEELRKTRTELELRLVALEKELSVAKLEKESIERRLEKSEQELQNANDQVAKKSQDLLDMTSQNFFLQERVKSAERQFAEYERIVESLKGQLKEREAAILEREKEILAKLRESAANHALEIARTADKAALDAAISMLKNQLAVQEEMANKRQLELEQKLKQRSEEVDELRNQLSEATEHIRSQSKELENAMKDCAKFEEQVTELNAQLQEKNKQLLASIEEIAQMGVTQRSLQAHLNEEKVTVAELKAQLSEKDKSVAELRAKLLELEKQMVDKEFEQQRMSGQHAGQLRELEMALQREKEQHVLKNQQLEATTSELQSLKNALAEADNRIKELQQELENSLAAQKSLQQSLEAQKEKMAEINAQLAQATQTNHQLQSKVGSLTLELQTAENNLSESKKLLEKQALELEEQTKLHKEQLAKSTALGNELNQTKAELQAASKRIDELSQSLSASLKKEEKATAALKEREAELEKTKSQNEWLQQEVDTLKQQLESHQAALNDSQNQQSEKIVALSQQLLERSNEVAQLQREVQLLQNYKAQKEDIEMHATELQEKLSQTEDAYKRLAETLSALEEAYLEKVNDAIPFDTEEDEPTRPKASSLDEACHTIKLRLESIASELKDSKHAQLTMKKEYEEEIARLKQQISVLEELKITNFFSDGALDPRDVALAGDENAPAEERRLARERLEATLRRQLIYLQRLLALKMQALKQYWIDDAVEQPDLKGTPLWEYWMNINQAQFFYIHLKQQIAQAVAYYEQRKSELNQLDQQVKDLREQLDKLVEENDGVETVVYEKKSPDISFLHQPSATKLQQQQQQSTVAEGEAKEEPVHEEEKTTTSKNEQSPAQPEKQDMSPTETIPQSTSEPVSTPSRDTTAQETSTQPQQSTSPQNETESSTTVPTTPFIVAGNVLPLAPKRSISARTVQAAVSALYMFDQMRKK